VGELRADLGGTEILAPMEFALNQPRHADLPRQVVVMTDGQVTNTDAVLALVTRHAAEARVFTFGIGAGASQHLVRGLARAGRGTAEFIYPGERIEPKVVRQFGRLLSPALHDVKVEWVGGEVTSMPMKVPPVFADSRLLVYGFPRSVRPVAVRLSAASPSGPAAFEIALVDSPVTSGKSVATLAARARIRELEESGEWLAAHGSRQRERKHDSVTREIIDLSIRYGLISRETSLVAVERRETPVLGDIQLRRVPIALTSGWGGIEDRIVRVGALRHARLEDAARFGNSSDTAAFSLRAPAVGRTLGGRLTGAVGSWFPRASTLRPAMPKRMHDLVALQQADGHWELSADLATIIGRDLSEIERSLDGASGSASDLRRAWATALAIAWLERQAAEAEEQWRMLSLKARKWLDNVAVIPAGGRTWMDAARRFLVA